MHASPVNTIDACMAAWVIGAALPLLCSELPSATTLALVGLAGIALLILGRGAWLRAAGALFVGFSYGAWAGHAALAQRLPDCAEGATLSFAGRIEQVSGKAPWYRVVVVPTSAIDDADPGCVIRIEAARLSWRKPTPPVRGEIWRIVARLRAPRGVQNANGFDYEAWLLAHSIDATGYVRSATRRSDPSSIESRWRRSIRASLDHSGLANRDILMALVLGDAAALQPSRWSVLRRTGTVHLLIVSGLHLGFIAGFGLLLGRWLWSVPWLLRRISARRSAGLGAVLLITLYATLAGWSLPIQRAWLMAVTMICWYQFGRRITLRRWFLTALATIVMLHPLVALTSGFWLSFGAVGLLLGFFAPRPRGSWIGSLSAAQAVLLVGLSPSLTLVSGQLSMLAPLANLIAVPVVSVLVVPLALTGAAMAPLLHSPGMALLTIADWTLGQLFRLLEFASTVAPVISTSFGSLDPVPLIACSALAIALVAAVCLPIELHLRALLIAALWLMLSRLDARPPFGEFELTVLDVGQGLALLIRTANHDMLYDAGDRYPSGFDVGAAVVVPRLRSVGIRRLDALTLSHEDRDHSGGASAVISELNPRWITAQRKTGKSDIDQRCMRGERRQWDGVVFDVLHPATTTNSTGNDHSCVVLVTATQAAALLPGDIERTAEQRLNRLGLPKVDVLVGPHHGSRTSSTRQLLAATHPRLVLLSNGFGNRFGHPHPDVLERYARIGARWYSTSHHGALVWRSEEPQQVRFRRAVGSPYWRSSHPAESSEAGSASVR